MARVTADDVLAKNFQHAQGVEGYAQDEVDDFLDLVGESIRDFEAENLDLAARLAAAEQRAELLAAAPAPQFDAPVAAVEEPAAAASLLGLAQKLHDEHVSAGQQEADELVAAAKVEAERLVAEAQEASDRKLGDLERDSAQLQEKVDGLRAFEADYRERLRGHLEALLGEVDAHPAQDSAQD